MKFFFAVSVSTLLTSVLWCSIAEAVGGCYYCIPVTNVHLLAKRYPSLPARLKQIFRDSSSGRVFYNRERCLPKGTYSEYYLNIRKRDSNRIVISTNRIVYFTEDHYASFYHVKYNSMSAVNMENWSPHRKSNLVEKIIEEIGKSYNN